MTKAWLWCQHWAGITADVIFGSRCDRCAQRVYSRDLIFHNQDCD